MASKENQKLLDAASTANLKKVKSLLKKGVSPKSKDKFGLDVLYHAINTSLISIQPEKAKEQAEILQLLISAGADVNTAYKYLFGYTPLIVSSSDGNIIAMEILLDLGADIHKADDFDFTPLHRAALNGRAKAVKLLLARGADKRKKTDSGETALKLAKDGQKESSGLEGEDYPTTIKFLRMNTLKKSTKSSFKNTNKKKLKS